MRATVLLAALMACVGCSTHSTSAPPKRHTIADDSRLPRREIQVLLSPSHWRELSEKEYEARLVIHGSLNDRGDFQIQKIVESFPDAAWNRFAAAAVKDVIIHPTYVGSHIAPTAEAYVVLYGNSKEGRLALVFARQTEINSPRDPRTRSFLHIRILPQESQNKSL